MALPTQITVDSVVLIHYTLRNDAGEVLDSSSGGEPLAYLHGRGNIVPGLERALEGKRAGDELSVKIAAEDGYGAHDVQLIQQVPRSAFPKEAAIAAGMRFHAQSPEGARTVTVTQVSGESVTVDGNHPLAGATLNFEVQIAEVRAATHEELAHGHVHGAGGDRH